MRLAFVMALALALSACAPSAPPLTPQQRYDEALRCYRATSAYAGYLASIDSISQAIREHTMTIRDEHYEAGIAIGKTNAEIGQDFGEYTEWDDQYMTWDADNRPTLTSFAGEEIDHCGLMEILDAGRR